MGFVSALLERIATALSSTHPPEGMEQLAVVRPFQVPVLEQVLRTRGIDCQVVEQLSPGSWEQMSIILVAEDNLPLANDALRDFHRS